MSRAAPVPDCVRGIGVTRIEPKGASTRRSPRRWGLGQWSGVTAIAVALVAASLAAFAVLSGLSLQAEGARADIERQLGELTGLPVSIQGTSSFSLLPKTQIQLSRIRIGAPAGAVGGLMTVETIVADLDLWDALLGRAKIERLTVVRPELLATARFMNASTEKAAAPSTGKTGRLGETATPSVAVPTRVDASSEARIYREMSQYFAVFLSRFGDLRSVDIRDGVFRLAPGRDVRGITDANIVISWPSPRSAARMVGSYVWNGEPTDIDLKLAAPLEFLGGGASAVDFTLAAPPLAIAFSGSGSTSRTSGFTGNLKLSTPSLRRSIRWLGDSQAALPDLGAMAIEATIDSNGQKLNLRDANVTIVGFSGRGAVEMQMAPGGVPAVSGTLAFDRLDLTAFAQAITPLPRNALDFQRKIAIAFLDKIDLDLRISAGQGAIGSVPITDLAATVKFKDGVATLDIGDAVILGGQGQARLSLDSHDRSPTARGSASVSGIDTARLLEAVGVSAIGVSGLSDLNAEVGVPVTSWADIARRLDLALEVYARGGSLSGFDPAVFLGAGTKPFALATGTSAIPFQTLRARLTSHGPRIAIQSLNLKGGAGTFEASGDVSNNDVDVSGSFTPNQAASDPALVNSKPVSFRMSGEWPRPIVTTGPPVAPM